MRAKSRGTKRKLVRASIWATAGVCAILAVAIIVASCLPAGGL